MKDDIQVIQEALGRLIMASLRGAASEQYMPNIHDPDRMDDAIKFGREQAEKLRKLREEFENVVTGILRI